MADKERILAVTSILLSLLPVIAAYQCHGVLQGYLLISRKRLQVAMLNAAMEYNKALARMRHVKTEENHSTKSSDFKENQAVRMVDGGEMY